MTILQVMSLHPYKLGSFEEYILAFTQEMHRRGHKVLYVFGGEPHPYVAEKLNELGSEYFIQKAPKGIGEFFGFLHRLINIIRNYRVDIIQAQFFPHANYGVFAGFLTIRPVYQTIHTLSILDRQPIRPLSVIKSMVSSYMSQKIFAVSDIVREDLIHTYHIAPGKIQVLYNGINLKRYDADMSGLNLYRELGIEENCRIVLVIAHARLEKGIDYLIRAIPAILATHPFTHFVFCGGGPLENDLKNLTVETGVSSNVHFLGIRNDVPYLLRHSYITALTSITEACPYALLEAMASSRAVVATKVGGIPELVIDNKTGLLIPPKDVDSIAEAIIFMLSNPEKAEKFGREGRKRIEQEFELNGRVISEIEIYENSLARRGQ